jgi:hypothetical protein
MPALKPVLTCLVQAGQDAASETGTPLLCVSKVVRTNFGALLVVRRLLDQFADPRKLKRWRGPPLAG